MLHYYSLFGKAVWRGFSGRGNSSSDCDSFPVDGHGVHSGSFLRGRVAPICDPSVGSGSLWSYVSFCSRQGFDGTPRPADLGTVLEEHL